MTSQARSPLLAEPPLTDQALIDHFGKLMDGADWWVALKLTGADATQENAKAVCRKLLLRLHPDKCKLPAAAEAFRKFNHFRDKIAKRPYSMSAPAHASDIRPVPATQRPRPATAAELAKQPRTATATGRGMRGRVEATTNARPKPAQPKPVATKAGTAKAAAAVKEKPVQAKKPKGPAAAAVSTAAKAKTPSVAPPSAPAAAASECKACKGWRRKHTCGKKKGKPGPKPRLREGCQGCLGLHMVHTCGLHGRPEARQPHVWSTRPSPEIPP